MEILIFGVFFAFFILFFKVSMDLARPFSYIFVVFCAILCMIMGISLINEGIDVTWCGQICNTTNYQNIWINGIGVMIFALSLFFIGMSIYEPFFKAKDNKQYGDE